MSPHPNALSVLFIGGGNMAQAMISGMLQSESGNNPYRITVVETDQACRNTLSEKWGHTVAIRARITDTTQTEIGSTGANNGATDGPDWVVLAVKPQQTQEALSPVRQALAAWERSPSLLSIAAGITIASLTRWSGIGAVVRTMPNTPAMVQQGVTGAYAVPTLSEALRVQADTMLRRLGAVVWVDEERRLDAVTALSGSGPAYVFYFLEAFASAGESLGLPKKDSETLALQTLKGALALVEQSKEEPAALRAKVTSKGGTTAAALAVLEARPGLMGLMQAALTAAHHRAQEMAKDYAA